MDKIAIISDVHGCYIALKNVLDDIKARGIKHIFMIGDLVAKGSQPKECIDLIRENCEVVIKGNCDDIVAEKGTTKEHFWNKEKIGIERQNYLARLPIYHDFYLSGLKIRLLHAGPETMYESIKIYSITNSINDEIKDMFKNSDFIDKKDLEIPDVVIFGHIHSPLIYRINDKTLVNSGSVSNSCDLINKNNKTELISSYLILEGDYNSKEISNISYEIIKIPFDYEKEIENLRKSDMPNKEMAIEELKTGVYKHR